MAEPLPSVCNTCFGDNHYVRLLKAYMKEECKICVRPYTVFRWQPERNARFKKTIICHTCSDMNNVCQVCLLDLDHQLPVQVRDEILATSTSDSIPRSNVNKVYFAEEHDRKARAGINNRPSYAKSPANETLMRLGRKEPYYKRNRPHICSFYVRGECRRGVECPYRHEMPVTGELAKQNIEDRYHGIRDPVAVKLLKKIELEKQQLNRMEHFRQPYD